ncbi:MAG: TIGR02757 family protein [Deltaproteobacteria bacterium]|nr:TIGR02757 family protein [Deltaproteobacteria bacterium]
MKKIKSKLDEIYKKYNKKEFIHPDPLEFLNKYEDVRDREIVGLIASSLAFGRVAQILLKTKVVLDILGDKPSIYLKNTTRKKIKADFKGYQYRFVNDNHMISLLITLKKIIKEYGDIYSCFVNGFSKNDETLIPALDNFSKELDLFGYDGGILIPYPSKGSACKKFNLFLRWMVRSDDVDPGGWDFPKSKLVIPLDTHMMRFASDLGFTKRKQANLKTALEITEKFRKINHRDPVKYDFALTRYGIREELTHEDLIESLFNLKDAKPLFP